MAIEHYRYGTITIDGITYTDDVIVWPEGVDDSWWRVNGHCLSQEDLEPILSKDPEAIVIGTGSSGAMDVPAEVRGFMEERCSEVHIERTEPACALLNELMAAGRRAVAGLHLTC